jgi:ATP/maltotriose-dependent transcriptional regulator MalT
MGESAAETATSERDVLLATNEVAGQPDANEALLLVLDDYHVISSRLVHESLGFLIEHRPPGLHLALTSRSDPPLALARRQRGLDAQDVAPGAGRGSVTAVQGLVEQLTSRELEVLAMLAAGRSNQAIASQLVVTLDTVKKHVSHVLGKLCAANRTEAVTRAPELSLIS